jgi:hypothetical protein
MSNQNKKTEAKEMNRHIRTEMARHSVDCSEVITESSHGVIQLYGKVKALKGHEGSFSAERDALIKGLRQKSGIRDVIINWTVMN